MSETGCCCKRLYREGVMSDDGRESDFTCALFRWSAKKAGTVPLAPDDPLYLKGAL
jgi:hypothetical protein